MGDQSADAVENALTDADRTVVHQTFESLARFHDQVAVTVDTGQTLTHWTHQDLLERTRRETRRLTALGIERGSVVSLMTSEHPVTFTLRWATNALGATLNVIPDGFAVAALAEILQVTRPNLVLTDHARHAAGVAAAARAGVAWVVDIGSEPPPADASPIPILARRGELAAMQLTSGTTGSPKAVPRWVTPPTPPPVLDGWGDVVQLLWTPVAHVGGAVAMMVMRAGGRVVMQPEFDPGRVLAAIEREQVTLIMPLFPRYLSRLLDAVELARTDTSSLRDLRLGGAPVSPTRVGEAVDRFGPIVGQVYGTIEATNVATISAEELARPELRSTVGRPAAGVELSLRGSGGQEQPVGEVSEVWVRGPAVMPGYVNAPEDTAAVLQDGWLYTGDLGRLDDAGYLTLVGRSKDLIYAERARIHPPDIEAVLAEHPRVAAAAVFAVSDRDGVEAAAAAVVARGPGTPSGGELIAWVVARRGAWFAPTVVHFVEELPTVAGGKVDRRVLREWYSAATTSD